MLIAESHVGGELEGGHPAGVQEASPGAFAVRAGSTVCLFGLVHHLDGATVTEGGELFGFAAEQPGAGGVVSLSGEELLSLAYGLIGSSPFDGVRLVGVGARLDDLVPALF